MSYNPQVFASLTTSFALRNRRRAKSPSFAPTLMVEAAAFLFFLILVVSVSVEIKHQDKMKMMWESPGSDSREVAQNDIRVSQLEEISSVWQ